MKYNFRAKTKLQTPCKNEGLWANLAHIDGDNWINLEQVPIWEGAPSGMTGKGSNEEELGDLKFGYPNMTLLPDNRVYVVFLVL